MRFVLRNGSCEWNFQELSEFFDGIDSDACVNFALFAREGHFVWERIGGLVPYTRLKNNIRFNLLINSTDTVV